MREPLTLNLPASVKRIQEEAFVNCAAEWVILPSGCESIDARAFADSENLLCICIPEGVTEIAEDAFAGCDSLKIFCVEGSFAQEYAETHRIPYVIR